MLNEQQKQAEADIKKWLNSDKKYHILSGFGGTGKTFLINHIVDNLGNYNKRRKLMGHVDLTDTFMTATTNKAASLLPNGSTIHSLLKLIVKKRKLVQVAPRHTLILNSLIIIDEISAASSSLWEYIDKLDSSNKILLVGDHAQLPPVGEDLSMAFKADAEISHLTQPMRQDSNSDLFKLCMQLRNTVETGVFESIEAGKGISFVSASDALPLLSSWFKQDINAKYIGYTNKQVIAANQAIRTSLGRPTEWQVGDLVVIRNSTASVASNKRIPCETVTKINSLGQHEIEGIVPYRWITTSVGTLKVPHDWNDVIKRQNQLKATKAFYDFEGDYYADIRDAYACTAHVSQGSTYDKVLVDLKDLTKCAKYDRALFAKLLYVAVSRAKEEVVFYGNIPTHLLR